MTAPDLLLVCGCGNRAEVRTGAFDVQIFGLLQWRCQRCQQVHSAAPGQPWGLPPVEPALTPVHAAPPAQEGPA